MVRARLHDTATAPLPSTATAQWKWVEWYPMRPFACQRRRRRCHRQCRRHWWHAVPIGSCTHFCYGKNAVHGIGAVAVPCKQALIYTAIVRVLFETLWSTNQALLYQIASSLKVPTSSIVMFYGIEPPLTLAHLWDLPCVMNQSQWHLEALQDHFWYLCLQF